MLIANRNGMAVKGGWKNPYVTDGLVAMYDGVWNDAPGVHSQSKVCNNIVADKWHGVVGGDVEIGEDYFGFDGTIRLSSSIQIGNSWFGKPEYLTTEVCFVSTGDAAQNQQCCFGGSEGTSSGISFFSSSIYCFGSFSSPISAPTRSFNISSWKATSIPQTIALSVGSAISFAAVNGTMKSQKSGGTVDWSRTIYNCFIGCDASNPVEYALKGKVYSVRVYSRALSTDEIAANYAIDKARFNLP